jgi:hypothetical protein
LHPGEREFQWQAGHHRSPNQILSGDSIRTSFGLTPQDDQTWGFVISDHRLADVTKAGGIENIPWVRHTAQVRGTPFTGDAYEPVKIGFERRSWWGGRSEPANKDLGLRAYGLVQGVFAVRDNVRRRRGQVFRPGVGWMPKHEIVKESVHVRNFVFYTAGRAMLEPQGDGWAALDTHLHGSHTFSNPYYPGIELSPTLAVQWGRRGESNQTIFAFSSRSRRSTTGWRVAANGPAIPIPIAGQFLPSTPIGRMTRSQRIT